MLSLLRSSVLLGLMSLISIGVYAQSAVLSQQTTPADAKADIKTRKYSHAVKKKKIAQKKKRTHVKRRHAWVVKTHRPKLIRLIGTARKVTRVTKKPIIAKSLYSERKRLFLARGLNEENSELKGRSAEPQADEEFEGEAEDRLDWFVSQRAYPFKEIPDGARREAGEYARNRPDLQTPDASGTTWIPIGPLPTTSAFPDNGGFSSGRIPAIAVSPANNQIVLVGSAIGGIWRSINGGTTFVPVSDDQVDLAVGSIAFSRSNPNIVYAGMGDLDQGYFGTGVLKSTDAGATWTRVSNNTFPDRGNCVRVIVDPTDPDRVYVAQFNSQNPSTNGTFISGIYVSSDGGISWARTLTGGASDLAMHPTNPQILYAGMRSSTAQTPGQGLYRSTNAGMTWTKVFDSPYDTNSNSTRDFLVAVTPAAPNRVYIYFGTRATTPADAVLEMSNDSGVTWTNRGAVSTDDGGIDTGQFGYNSYLAVSPTNANTLYVGSRDTFRSTDGGVTFTNVSNAWAPPYGAARYQPRSQLFHSDQQSLTFQPGSGSVFYCGNDGGVWKTTDGGTTFASLNLTLSLTQFVSLARHPTDPSRTYGGTQDNGSQRRTTGSGWTEYSGGDGGNVVVDPIDPSRVYPSYVNGTIYRFINNGVTRDRTISTVTTFGEPASRGRIAFYPPIVGNGVDSQIYTGTFRLFVCSNCATATTPSWTAPGGTFDQTKGGTDVLSALAVARSNDQVIYSGSRSGRAMVSIDGGADWTDITAGLPDRAIASITPSSTNPSLVYLTVSGYRTGHVFRSTNSGATWTNISNNLPDIPTASFMIDPMTPTTLYAGTDIGVFRSTDNGESWTAFNTGLPPVPVMAFTAGTNGVIQIGTFGRGAYELTVTANPTPTPTPTPMPSCTPNANVARDGGFEQNTAQGTNPNWTSTGNFPLCTVAGCQPGPNQAPRTGNGWIWFDGAANGTAAEAGTVTQTLTLPAGGTSSLNYFLRIGVVTAPSTSTIQVRVDGSTVQTINEPATAETAYSLRTVDLSAFNDGAPHAVSFAYNRPAGTTGSDSFTIDDVTLSTSCPAPPLAAISISNVTGTESGGSSRPTVGNAPNNNTFDFVVTRTDNLDVVSTVHYETVDGTATVADHDYEPTSGTLTFAVGESILDVFVVVDGDDNVEPDETFTVHLDTPTAAIITNADGLGTILNDDDGGTPTPTPSPTPTPVTSCTPNTNILLDGGFEATGIEETTGEITNPNWSSTSTLYNTSLCSIEGCGTGEPPRTGSSWVWFDGTGSVEAESGTARQTITIRPGSDATLSYYLRVSEVTAPSNSTLTVSVDGTIVQTITEPAAAESGYTLRTVNLSAFANGQPRMLSFNYTRPAGTTGSDSFLIDDVTVATACAAATASITGRVFTPSGTGLRNAVVSLTNPQGVRVTATTSSFGVYSFGNIPSGQVYILAVSSKRYRFAAQNLTLDGNLANFDFVGLE